MRRICYQSLSPWPLRIAIIHGELMECCNRTDTEQLFVHIKAALYRLKIGQKQLSFQNILMLQICEERNI